MVHPGSHLECNRGPTLGAALVVQCVIQPRYWQSDLAGERQARSLRHWQSDSTSKVPCCRCAQRAVLLKQGLGDRAASVREAASSMLHSWLAGEACGQEPLRLLAGLQVTEFEGEHPPLTSVGSSVLHSLQAGPASLLTGMRGTRAASRCPSWFQSELCIILVSTARASALSTFSHAI